MNFRKFCIEPGYSHFIGMTYNIDLQFFDSIVLRDLLNAGTTKILILCDANPLQQSLARISSELDSLGKEYILQPVNLNNGAFHPKLYLKICSEGAIIFLGSGNLSFGGAGGNKEIYTVWNIKSENQYILNEIVSIAEEYSSNELARNYLDDIRNTFGIVKKGTNKASQPFAMSSSSANLSTILKTRWAGRTFEKLTIFTGSTDEKGAFINWCHKQFNIQECVLIANEYNISFEKNILNKIPVNIHFGFPDPSEHFHGKIYMFENKDDLALICGSANCSAAAWLSQTNNGGNVEAINIYDKVDKTSLKHIYSKIPQKVIDVSLWEPRAKAFDNTQRIGTRYIIGDLYYEPLTELIKLKLDKPEDYQGIIQVYLDSTKIQLFFDKKNNLWSGNLNSIKFKSSIVKIKFVDNGETSEILHWINYPDEIRDFSFNYKVRSVLSNISEAGSYSKFTKVLMELAQIQSVIFDHTQYETKRTSTFTVEIKRDEKKDEIVDNVETMTPDMIIKSISEFSHTNSSQLVSGLSSYTYSGIIKFLFDDFKETFKEDFEEENKDGDDDDEIDYTATQKNKVIKARVTIEELPEKDAERLYAKLEDLVDSLIENIQGGEFYTKCSARQLADTVAFCLLVSHRVLRKSPLFFPLSNKLLFEVIHTLFYMNISGVSQLGIYTYNLNKYKTNGMESEFIQQINNGYLWIALLYTIVSSEYDDPSDILQKSIVLKYLYQNTSLYSHIDINKLGIFSNQSNLRDNLNKLFERLPIIIDRFGCIENYYFQNYDRLKMQSIKKYEEGNIIYNKKHLWAKVLSTELETMKVLTFYDGRELEIEHHYKRGFWISPILLRSQEPELNGLFELLENEFKIKTV